MARAFLLACLLALPGTSSAARMAVKAVEEVPWRKAAVVGAVLGNTLGGNLVAARKKREAGQAGETLASATADSYDRVQSLLLDIFHGGSAQDEAAFGKFIEALRGSADDQVAETLEARLSSAIAEKLEVQGMNNPQGRRHIEQLTLPAEHGVPGFVIGHYPAFEHRTTEEVRELQGMLRCVEQSKGTKGLFVKYFAQSHTPEELDTDPGAEVIVMFELPIGTLRSVWKSSIKLDLEARVRLILQVYALINRLRNHDIAHRSDITPDTVLMVSDAGVKKQTLGLLFTPKIISSTFDPMRSADERFDADVRQFGTLLRFMLTSDWAEDEQEIVDVLLAFGKALESGAFVGEERVSAELSDLMKMMRSGTLTGKRVEYLRLAVEAEMAAEHGMLEVEVPNA